MKALLEEIRHNPLLWLLAFVPMVLAAARLMVYLIFAMTLCRLPSRAQ